MSWVYVSVRDRLGESVGGWTCRGVWVDVVATWSPSGPCTLGPFSVRVMCLWSGAGRFLVNESIAKCNTC